MFIKRAKSRPSLRARESDIDPEPSPLGQSSVTAQDVNAEDNDPESSVGNIMERRKAQKAKRDKRLIGVQSSSVSRLSFGSDAGEGDGDISTSTPKSSRLGKSSLSRNIDFASSPAASPGPSSNYSREYLDQLKAATPSRSAKAGTNEGDEDGSNGGLSRLAQQKYASQFAEDTTAGIPDAAAVQAAKMKRQAALESAKHGGGDMNEDYIALGGGKLIIRDGQSGPHPESRLMREDDEGDEGDEGVWTSVKLSGLVRMG
jgi:GC-rich sequence DNA-binding factor